GESLGDHGMYLKGPYFYEASVHVPLIASWPGKFRQGEVSDALVELVDLAPTLLEACGLPDCAGMQGRSLYGLLTGQTPLGHFRDSVYSEYYKYNKTSGRATLCTMVYDGRHKLTKIHTEPNTPPYGASCPGELYDLEQDPAETVNLYGRTDRSDVQLRMLELLSDRMAWICDPLPLPRAPW
ncbi:MAG TPA: DUF4976 domain-containing protein, partial [Clostridia bacterium]|nr:DUF4976 domain-containing protein [Clostridia bacterium]